ncbi:transmembrane protein 234 homolog [Hetaerina americana]|uniref:transmembrane protein 234 homolog n=1 Tax=Hetaerina americana TaxID=62018 RepID=UPI003A7F3461
MVASSSHQAMGTSLGTAAYLVFVAFLWGATNPLIKKGSVGVERVNQGSAVLQFMHEIKFLVLNWKYVIPFLINQGGSVLYFSTLKYTDISLAVPLTNALTFLFTWIVGRILGEEPVDKRTILGMVFIMLGIGLCCLDKVGEKCPSGNEKKMSSYAY